MRSTLPISTVLSIVVVLSGCAGADSMSTTAGTSVSPSPTRATRTPRSEADRLAGKARAALDSASSVHVSGTMATDRIRGVAHMAGRPMRVDLTLANTGGSGTVVIEGASVRLIVVGQTGYVQPSPSFWRAQVPDRTRAEEIIRLFRGKWLMVSAESRQFGSIVRLGQKNDLIQTLFDDLGPSVRTTRPRPIDGVTCVGILGGGRVLWVRPSDTRAVRHVDPKESANLRFDRYDVAAPHAKPPDDLVIDYDNF